jgi:antitoxin (DNA-binding transcriptional repressor) of toxin-antitoxin stability system
MLEKIGSYEARTKLSEILRRVEAGEAFTITNRGLPFLLRVDASQSPRMLFSGSWLE